LQVFLLILFHQTGLLKYTTECVANLDKRSKTIIFWSILTTFESSRIFGGSWGSIENWLKPKTEIYLSKSVKHLVFSPTFKSQTILFLTNSLKKKANLADLALKIDN